MTPLRRIAVALTALLLSPWGLLVAEGEVVVVRHLLSDNGDDDGFADSNERVELRIVARNTTAGELTGVVARLTTTDSALACLTDGEIGIGSLAAGEERLIAEPFVLQVHPDVERVAVEDELVARLAVRIDADQLEQQTLEQRILLHLDLDASPGSGAGNFIEGFEAASGFGSFEAMHLDSEMWGDDNITYESLCRYSIPEVCATCWGCDYIGNTQTHADEFHWQIDDGRAFAGGQSLYMGIELSPFLGYTTPMDALEAVASNQPINLDVGGSTAPELTFKHQISLLDHRTATSGPSGHAADRGIVQLQRADALGAPVGDWLKLYPTYNRYDQLPFDNYSNCTYDPVDDGSTADDFFPLVGPFSDYGPSSTCKPERAFAYLGSTEGSFDPADVGNAADGPGLQGSLGAGTWVESRFDLSSFRGQRIRIRFLTSSMGDPPGPPSGDYNETWEELFNNNPNPGDDGWWIDAVSVTATLATAAGLTPDTKDNSSLPNNFPDGDQDGVYDVCDNCPGIANALQQDVDQDDAGAVCDCNDYDGNTYPGAEEVNDGVDNQCPGETGHGAVDELTGTLIFADEELLQWPAQAGASGYEVKRAAMPGFETGCSTYPTPDPQIVDRDSPATGELLHYLARSTAPHLGSFGVDSAGIERSVNCLP